MKCGVIRIGGVVVEKELSFTFVVLLYGSASLKNGFEIQQSIMNRTSI